MTPAGGTQPLVLRASGRTAAVSPLRYPGGKAALAGFFGGVISRLGIEPATYVEPYAGGAGAGIALLRQDVVQNLVINDIDPAVRSFWASVTSHAERFAALIADTPLDVDEWRKQKAIYRASDESDQLALGFAFFYLNRTNRSGILNAGPIGGVRQDGNYKIDARFNRDQLTGRVVAIGALAPRITVLGMDGMAVVHRYACDSAAFVYIDPPYVDMGRSLYLNAFTHRDHADLAGKLDRQQDGNWVVTYDPSSFVRQLYRRHDVREYQLSYSAHRTGKASELLIASSPVARILAADSVGLGTADERVSFPQSR
jgi:DNA adenine methylase